jgi:hypothetical protein
MIRHSRFLAGTLNGNIGVMKSMLAEIADETNMAQAFSLIPLSLAIGSTTGYVNPLLVDWLSDRRRVHRPYFGGLLSRPHDRWPDTFSHSFWKQYPYFLPCVATSAYGIASLIIASVFLKEVDDRSGIFCVYVELTRRPFVDATQELVKDGWPAG